MVSRQDMKKLALARAKANMGDEPTVSRFFWFPHEDELRLIEVDECCLPSEEVFAFHFGPGGDVPVPSALALIRAEEVPLQLKLPDGWGTWGDAEEITGEMDHKEVMRKWVLDLAQSHKNANPFILKSFWFPHGKVIRVVHVVEDSLPDDEILPLCFLPSQMYQRMHVAVAMIRAKEVRQLKLPDGWGTWDDAEEIVVSRDSMHP